MAIEFGGEKDREKFGRGCQHSFRAPRYRGGRWKNIRLDVAVFRPRRQDGPQGEQGLNVQICNSVASKLAWPLAWDVGGKAWQRTRAAEKHDRFSLKLHFIPTSSLPVWVECLRVDVLRAFLRFS